jgi:uncharacterized protein YcbK (DUF882 family)
MRVESAFDPHLAPGPGMSVEVDPHDAAVRSRRRFLQTAGAGLLLAPLGAAFAQPSPVRSLSLMHTHTGEALSAEYCSNGVYQVSCLAQVNRFLRDFRNGETHAIDPRLLDILYQLQGLANRAATYEVISGYRSPQTNAALHHASAGVAEHSLHMDGRAIDVRMTGFPTRKLRDLALSLRSGGVGYYARSDFVHLDTGRVRSWGDRA